MQQHVLITGAGRGIGLEFARQYAEAGWRVTATVRDPAGAGDLQTLAARFADSLTVHPLDVSDEAQIDALAERLRGTPVDLLLNNAGVYGPTNARLGNLEEQPWLETLRVNTIAPLLMAQAFVEHVADSRLKTIATLSSKMGSMGDNGSGGSYIYRSAKAGLNAGLKSLAIDLAPRGINVLILHPGWVLTEMGGPHAEITATESVRRMRALIEQAGSEQAGQFLDIDGTLIPW